MTQRSLLQTGRLFSRTLQFRRAIRGPALPVAPSRTFHGHRRRLACGATPELDNQKPLTQQELKEVADEKKTTQLAFWVGSAMAFGAWIWFEQGPVKAQEYLAGYLLEQSLSVDNLFVFLLVFNYFQTPPEGQQKVLAWGIASAAVLRAVLILLGSELVQVGSLWGATVHPWGRRKLPFDAVAGPTHLPLAEVRACPHWLCRNLDILVVQAAHRARRGGGGGLL